MSLARDNKQRQGISWNSAVFEQFSSSVSDYNQQALGGRMKTSYKRYLDGTL